jgi:hypothetical protein
MATLFGNDKVGYDDDVIDFSNRVSEDVSVEIQQTGGMLGQPFQAVLVGAANYAEDIGFANLGEADSESDPSNLLSELLGLDTGSPYESNTQHETHETIGGAFTYANYVYDGL